MAGRALLTCVLAAALVGCAAEQAPVPPPPLTAEVKQYRRDIAARILSVAVTNPGDRAVVVRRLDLVAGGYADGPPAEVEVEVPAGRRVDVRVPYGPARCAGARPSGADAALLGVRDADGAAARRAPGAAARQRPAGPAARPGVRRPGAAGCRRHPAVPAVVASRRGAARRTRPRAALGRRAGDGRRAGRQRPVHRATGDPGDPARTLAADVATLELPLRITATRCDGHALAESKRSYVMTFYVALDGGEPQLISSTADEPLQRQLDRLALDTCRPGG